MSSDNERVIRKEFLGPISGFLEYRPDIERVRVGMLEKVRELFRSFGYLEINTPEVERLEILASKDGDRDVDREMYILDRATRDESHDPSARMGLRFDLTVPLARFVAGHVNDITFPFKRFHVGSCYRGERPQDGRFRQFVQADVDIIGNGPLPLEADLEVAEIGLRTIASLGLQNFTFRLSNRKLLQGILEAYKVAKPQVASRVLDKINKIGVPAARQMLIDTAEVSGDVADKLLSIASVSTGDPEEVLTKIPQLVELNETGQRGLEELVFVLRGLSRVPLTGGKVIADLAIIRGLDYYTGSIFEVTWEDHKNVGSISAGGRYDDLTGRFARGEYPGVGISIGFSRIFDKLVQLERIAIGTASPAQVLIARLLDDSGEQARLIADTLRGRGIKVEIMLGHPKLDKQMKYASKLGIPFVLFDVDGKVKNMVTREQTESAVDLNTWLPSLK